MTARLILGIQPDVYHADEVEPGPPRLNATVAKVLCDATPAHARLAHPRLTPRDPGEPTPAQARGTLYHRMILGAGAVVEVVKADDWRTSAAKAARSSARAAGRIPVLVADHAEAVAASEAIRARLAHTGYALTGDSEAVVLWDEVADDGTLVPCRAMFDHVWPDSRTGLDLKTLSDASVDACERQANDYGHDVQRAAYVSALRALGWERAHFVFAFAEVEAPHSVTIAELDGQFADLGERKWRHAVNLWSACTRTGEWSAEYTDGRARLAAKPWTLTRWEQR